MLRDAQGTAVIGSGAFDAVLLRAVDVKPGRASGDTAAQRREPDRAPRQSVGHPEAGANAPVAVDPALVPRVVAPTLSLRDAAKLDVGAQAALEQRTLPETDAGLAPDEPLGSVPADRTSEAVRGRGSPTEAPLPPARATASPTPPPSEPLPGPTPSAPARAPEASTGAVAPGASGAAESTVASITPPLARPARAEAPTSAAARAVGAVGSVRGAAPAQPSGQALGTPLDGRHSQSQRLLARLQGRAPASRAAADAKPVPSQVARALAEALRRGDAEVSLQLRPEALGRVGVRLSVREGKVEASITPETESARRLLRDSVPDLRAALEARDLRVERITIEPVPEPHGAPRQDADPTQTPTSTGGDSPGTQGGLTHGGGAEAQAGGGFVPPVQPEPLGPAEVLGIAAGVWRAPFTLDGAGRVRVDAFA
jgi:flagellar hook-length control protein FliK